MKLIEKLELFKNNGYTYDYITGEIKSKRGKILNVIDEKGYIRFGLNIYPSKVKIQIRAHQYAWFMYYGVIPSNQIDHINRNKKDNRIKNLRLLTNSQNQQNVERKGYSYDKKSKKFRSRIQLNNKSINIGYFENENDAHIAYLNYKKSLHIYYVTNN